MKEFIRKSYIYIFLFGSFYALPPLLVRDTGSAMFCLLLLLPIITLILSYIFAKTNGFKWHFSLLIALLWLPSIFIYYNESAVVYSAIYGIISLIGQGIGHFFSYNK